MEQKIIVGDCVEVMRRMDAESIDLVITSPPYDNLRTYNGYSFDFEATARELARLLKPGGVIVWVVGDATVKGSETGTSFKQALFFKEIGFNLYDTMIWEKPSMLPTQDRYYNVFEYMFVVSKSKPKTMSFLCDRKNTEPGRVQQKDRVIAKGTPSRDTPYFVRKEYGRRSNIWRMSTENIRFGHPAVFPQALARDHILSWSKEGDTVLDPFLGSGTTLVACQELGRKGIGIEISEEYSEIARKRLDRVKHP